MRVLGCWLFMIVMTASSLAQTTRPVLDYKIAIVGNPVTAVEWNETNLKRLKDAGFDTLQMNVAWGSRPHREALNLNDVVALANEAMDPEVARRNKELHERLALAKRLGFRTLFHFGSPFMWRNPETGEILRGKPDAFREPFFDTLNPKLVEYENGLLQQLVAQFPDLDDILIYTYDQDAWQASQFSDAKFSRGTPLHERLPVYLKKLHETFTANRARHRMWWEPWELSAGQIYKIIPQLPVENFGMIIHCNIAEAQIAKPVDLWYRQTARLCAQRKIPVIGEAAFCDVTEETQDWAIPCPRLVDEQFLAMTAVPGIVGIKEYFGVPLAPRDLNFEIFSARLRGATGPTDELIAQITHRFGSQETTVKDLLKQLADGIQMYPWEGAWQFRLTSHASTDHGWSAAYIHGQMADTPSWNSTRHAMFMVTDDRQQHPDLLEDIQLRCQIAADHFASGSQLAARLAKTAAGEDADYFAKLAKESDGFARVARSFALHLRETNVAWLLRGDLENHRPLQASLVEEMKKLLAADAENQHNQGRVVEMKRLFDEKPEQFLRTKLLPAKTTLEKGQFTVTTR